MPYTPYTPYQPQSTLSLPMLMQLIAQRRAQAQMQGQQSRQLGSLTGKGIGALSGYELGTGSIFGGGSAAAAPAVAAPVATAGAEASLPAAGIGASAFLPAAAAIAVPFIVGAVGRSLINKYKKSEPIVRRSREQIVASPFINKQLPWLKDASLDVQENVLRTIQQAGQGKNFEVGQSQADKPLNLQSGVGFTPPRMQYKHMEGDGGYGDTLDRASRAGSLDDQLAVLQNTPGANILYKKKIDQLKSLQNQLNKIRSPISSSTPASANGRIPILANNSGILAL